MSQLEELEAIKRLKYKYIRCIDSKLWEELREVFTDDADAAYNKGEYTAKGIDEVMEFLVGALGPKSMISSHRVHQPEIELTSPSTATATWALEDTVIETNANITIRGAAYYKDEYVKIDGQWKIRSTGYKRVFEEISSRADTPSLKLTSNCWAD